MKEFLKNTFKTLKSKIIASAILIVLVVVAMFTLNIVNISPKADTEFLNSLLTKSSELTTAKLRITGITNFKDSGIKFINRSDFIMVYTSTVRAGINVEDVKIEPDDINKKIYISIPEATVQEAKIDSSSIQYYNEELSLFNLDEKEDANRAQAEAEKNAIKEAEATGILELANNQSENLIKGILLKGIPDGYEMITKKIHVEQTEVE